MSPEPTGLCVGLHPALGALGTESLSVILRPTCFPKCVKPPQVEVEVLLEIQCEGAEVSTKTLVGRSVWGLRSLLEIPKGSKGIIRVWNGNGEIKRPVWRPARPVTAVY